MNRNQKLVLMVLVPMISLLLLTSVSLADEKCEKTAESYQMVILTYRVRPVIQRVNSYPYKSDILPPNRLHTVDLQNGQDETPMGFAATFASKPIRTAPTREERMHQLVELIRATVDPHSWSPAGEGTTRFYDNFLVVRQTKENHRKVQDLLEKIDRDYDPVHLVTIKAQWVLLSDDQLKQIVRKSDAKTSIPLQVDPKALEKIKVPPRYQAQTTCYSGQTVYVASGRGQTVVTSVQAVVTENVGTFQPMTKMVHWGAILEVNALLSRETSVVVVDLHSIVSEPKESADKPIPGANVSGAVKNGSNEGQVNRLNFSIQDMRTSLKVPLGKPVIVGGMTFSGTDSPLYLLIEVSSSK